MTTFFGIKSDGLIYLNDMMFIFLKYGIGLKVASNSRESAQFAGRPRLNSFMSTSCPDLRNQNLFSSSSQSLPARLDPVRLPWKPSRKTVVINGADEYPGTPPSSPVIHRMGNAQSSTTSENLVVIKVFNGFRLISFDFV